GATTRGGQENAAAGAGYWIDEDDPGNSSIKLPAAIEQTRPNAEIVAAMMAVQTTPVDIELRLENPRGSVLNAMTKNLTKWEDRGWIGVPNRSPLRALAAGLRQRTGKTTLAITKTSPGNTAAAALARSGTSKNEEDNIHLDVALDSQLPGARLSSLTQSIAYKGIKEMREPVSRKKTDEIVRGVQTAIKDTFSFHPKSPTIWKSIRHRDIGRNIRNFLWKSMHGAHRLGKWWLNIPECEERANCAHCGAEETLDHILLECPSPGQSEVWKLAEQFWTKKGPRWPAVSMGTILGSGLAVFKDDAGKPQPALARLYKILMTESAHVIWKLRCDSVIGRGGTPPSTHEVHNRWVKVMNERLEIDINLTNRSKYGKQHALSPALVLDTWRGTLLDEGTLPTDWLREPGVLVGITPKRSLRSPSPPIGRRGRN
ncbi:ribonuclease H-like protein, partial [Mycena leptocephala]